MEKELKSDMKRKMRGNRQSVQKRGGMQIKRIQDIKYEELEAERISSGLVVGGRESRQAVVTVAVVWRFSERITERVLHLMVALLSGSAIDRVVEVKGCERARSHFLLDHDESGGDDSSDTKKQ